MGVITPMESKNECQLTLRSPSISAETPLCPSPLVGPKPFPPHTPPPPLLVLLLAGLPQAVPPPLPSSPSFLPRSPA